MLSSNIWLMGSSSIKVYPLSWLKATESQVFDDVFGLCWASLLVVIPSSLDCFSSLESASHVRLKSYPSHSERSPLKDLQYAYILLNVCVMKNLEHTQTALLACRVKDIIQVSCFQTFGSALSHNSFYLYCHAHSIQNIFLAH